MTDVTSRDRCVACFRGLVLHVWGLQGCFDPDYATLFPYDVTHRPLMLPACNTLSGSPRRLGGRLTLLLLGLDVAFEGLCLGVKDA